MSAWKRYVVVLTSKDWYTLYQGAYEVKARSENEAIKKARKVHKDKVYPHFKDDSPMYHIDTEDIFGPFKN
jgi:hypothetical protein